MEREQGDGGASMGAHPAADDHGDRAPARQRVGAEVRAGIAKGLRIARHGEHGRGRSDGQALRATQLLGALGGSRSSKREG
jgi:hypothetical protein